MVYYISNNVLWLPADSCVNMNSFLRRMQKHFCPAVLPPHLYSLLKQTTLQSFNIWSQVCAVMQCSWLYSCLAFWNFIDVRTLLSPILLCWIFSLYAVTSCFLLNAIVTELAMPPSDRPDRNNNNIA